MPGAAACLQHGQGEGDPGSIEVILAAAAANAGGTPLTGVKEVTYLQAFLAARKKLLTNFDTLWAESVDRVTIYQQLLDLGKRRRGARAAQDATGRCAVRAVLH